MSPAEGPQVVSTVASPVVPVTHLLYLHGFRSSPQSTKARRMAGVAMSVSLSDAGGAAPLAPSPSLPTWLCPALPPSPAQAVAELAQAIQHWPRPTMAIMGSSLGGFYATVLAERLGCRAVLINPAVEPARDLARYIGEQTQWHDPSTRFYFDPVFIQELQILRPTAVSQPARYHVLVATGDEVLDWREMQSRYAGCQGELIQGGDHALSDFDRHLPGICQFLGWPLPPGQTQAGT